mgnify:CR=1 FL=1
MRAVSRSAVCNGRNIAAKLYGRKEVVRLTYCSLNGVARVPCAAVSLSVSNAGKYARGFVYFNARLLAESESCAVIVHTVYAQKPARFVEIDVAGLVKCVFNVYPTVRAATFEGRVGKLKVNVAAIKF